ncbi:MAG: hypothetical protein IJ083_06480 [Clostridia bacterium]|nr:hypothetical protein [Clostridia bacterium]
MPVPEVENLRVDDQKIVVYGPFSHGLFGVVEQLPEFVPPLVNEIFGEAYSKKTQVTLCNTFRAIGTRFSSRDRRAPDIVVNLKDQSGKTEEKTYILDCVTRFSQDVVDLIAEHIVSVACENMEMRDDVVALRYPNAAVMVLMPEGDIPRHIRVTLREADGQDMSYLVPVIRLDRYTLNDIFEKGLMILLPFYLYNFASEFEEMEADQTRREALEDAVLEIVDRLEQMVTSDELRSCHWLSVADQLYMVNMSWLLHYNHLDRTVGQIIRGAYIRASSFRAAEELGRWKVMALMKYLLKNGKVETALKATEDSNYAEELLKKLEKGEPI